MVLRWQRLAGSFATFVLLMVICYAVGLIGAYFTALGLRDWYTTLTLPWWTPAGSVIGAIWNVLYFLMAVSAWLVWRRTGFTGAVTEFVLFGLQLVLHATWSALFFAMRAPGLAAIEVWLFAAVVLATTLAFWRLNLWAGLLMLPYIAWVSFAAALNLAIWWLNR